ncbi:Asp-tRNA(Asn)/Glu-tRNA(Gln) amidotransferase subunit GatA [Shimazuella kribbensis]|uniref:Asp-tRNA(Asn)/Glu-tRNA(Gln) amidotransferase subunit GatA n=1 Tax=Shimazuella kribbensis TaxID=139808 RepID=UPI0003F53154|nr:Asp-tRNA(Asn)/Glu-tRNA(Gln) amidotransferase subunit GatA [Shimazuella kribbensis]
MSIREIHRQLAKKERSVTEIVEESLHRIKEVQPQIGSFLAINEEGAIEKAKELEQKLSTTSERGILAAIPTGVKDNLVTEGLTTTCASQLLANYQPIYNATVVNKLLASDAIIMGKTNMDEFAMGSSNENSSFHPVKNPWDVNRVPGGSSGGSAAAVATGAVTFALGSDTGGSIRQPAAFCGVVGLKPTYGRVSRFGLVAFASSLDQVGPITQNVEDAASVLQAISGHDELDSTSVNKEVPDYLSALTGEIKGLKVAVPREMLGEGTDPLVKAQIEKAVKQLEALGAHISEVSLPNLEYAVATYYILAPAEASSNLARFDGIRYGVRQGKNLLDIYEQSRSNGFGPEVKRRIMLGTYALSSGYYDAYYIKAQKARTLIKQDFDNIFAEHDVIVGPTAPTTAYRIGEKISDPLTMYLDDICTIPMNLAGLPAISVPAGLAQGLPVGLQIIGKAFAEETVLRVAHAFEQTAGRLQLPALGGVKA